MDRVKLRRMEANARERNRMHGLNNLTGRNPGGGEGSPYHAAYPGAPHHSPGAPPASGPYRPFGYCGSYEAFCESPSPECSSPPINFNAIFSLKHEEQGDYGKSCHYGVRYCTAPAQSALTSDLHFPYDLHLRGQLYHGQEELHTTFHN
uniref:Uncharacterized protein n=1 Tax=Denticeps clupeoides TaxID=299321 RepID=A0AAY3ZW12_9TELE